MNNIFGTIALLSLSIPGFFINSIIFGKKRLNESLALSWLTGSIVSTILIHIFNVFVQIKLNLFSSLAALIGLTLITFIVARKDLALPKIEFKHGTFIKIILLVFIILTFATSFFFPITDWDAVTLYDFRAKILLATGFIEGTTIQMLYGGYPMYTSLLHFWVYVTGLWTAMPVYPLFTISLAAGVYFAFIKHLGKAISFLAAIAILAAPRLFANSFIAYTNLPYAVFLILGAIYIYLWTKNGNWRNLIIGIILSAATFWIRSFPFAIVNFALIFLAIPFVNKYSKHIILLGIVTLLGSYIVPVFHPTADYLKWAVFKYYSPYWIIFLGIFIYKFISKSKEWYWILAYIGYTFMLLIGTFIFEARFPGYSLSYNDAVRRMTIFLNPIVILSAATILLQVKHHEENK